MTIAAIAASPPPTIQDLRSIAQFSKSDSASAYKAELYDWAGANPVRLGIMQDILDQGGYRAKYLELEAESTETIKDLPFPPKLDTLALDHPPKSNFAELHDVLEQIFTDVLKSVPRGHIVEIHCHFDNETDVALLQGVLAKVVANLAFHQRAQLPVTAKIDDDTVFKSDKSHSIETSASKPETEISTTSATIETSSAAVASDATQIPVAADGAENVAANDVVTNLKNHEPTPVLHDEIRAAIATEISQAGGFKFNDNAVETTCFISGTDFDSTDNAVKWCALNTNGTLSLVTEESAKQLLEHGGNHPLLSGVPLKREHVIDNENFLKLLKDQVTKRNKEEQERMRVANEATIPAAVASAAVASANVAAAPTSAVADPLHLNQWRAIQATL